MIKIGYQGIEGSNSEIVAKKFQNKLVQKSIINGLISSKNVIEKLKNDEIDYGVVAIENKIAGIVEETKEALLLLNYKVIDEETIPIHHCVFKNKNVSINDIEYVASHVQTIKQTEKTIIKNFGNLNVLEEKDTALCAYKLAKGELPNNTIIICNKDIGIKLGLDMVLENAEDISNNSTTFLIISTKKGERNYVRE